MKRDSDQYAVTLFEESIRTETALGESNPHASAAIWNGDSSLLGQVATPQPIAELMAHWVMSGNPNTVLDPAVGLGSLIHECKRLGPYAKFVGVERDERTLERAKRVAPAGTTLLLADYLLSAIGNFDGIISNPPYVKAHRSKYSPPVWRAFDECFGTRLNRLTNLYALFLLKIWADLAPKGRAAVLLPAEFLNANFGEEIKDRLVRVMRPPGMIVFNPELNLFKNALTTSAIIFLEKDRAPFASSRLVKADSLDEARDFVKHLISNPDRYEDKFADLTTFDPAAKWINSLFADGNRANGPRFPRKVSDYFRCSRGIATGANSYFTLSRSDVRKHELNLNDFDPCITKAIDATGFVFSQDKFEKLVAADRKCYLLNPRQQNQFILKYLTVGERLGIPQRHLPSHRPDWYRPENRAVADIWVAVFSRGHPKFILNKAGIRNLTCFHGLYAKPGYRALAPLLTLYLNSTWGRRAFAEVNRFYGDGLNKLEPKDVEALPCPEFQSIDDEDAARVVSELEQLEKRQSERGDSTIDELASRYIQGFSQSSRESL